MADIRRIADEKRRAVDFRKRCRAVIGYMQRKPVQNSERGGVRAQDEGGKRVDLDGDQLCLGKRLGGSEQKSSGTSARIHDPGGNALSARPCCHGSDNGFGRIDGAASPARFRRT